MRRTIAFVVSVVVVFAVGAAAGAYVMHLRAARTASSAPAAAHLAACAPTATGPEKPSARLVDGRSDTLDLPAEIVERLGIRTVEVDSTPGMRPLRMPGSLMLDANRLARVHSRFEGHVVSLGTFGRAAEKSRPLQFGDAVAKDQTLAVVWSKEIGQKKSELLDAYSQYGLGKATLERLKSLRPGEVSEHVLRDAQRAYEGALIAVQNCERTLRSWQLSEADLDVIRREADRLHEEGESRPATAALREGWAELEVRSPIDGVILEKNVTVGELVDASLDLFKVGDVSRLVVVANVYEEDLAEIEALPEARRRWTVRLTAEPQVAPLHGSFDLAGRIIDPLQHTAQLIGHVANPDGRLMAGQFITATVDLPPHPNEVVLPATAVIDSGEGGVAFVVDPEKANRFTRRAVVVAERTRSFVHVRTLLSDDEREKGFSPLTPGSRVAASGLVILDSTLKELQLAGRARSSDLVDQAPQGP
jgi:cobalt-zinc-cadmium efflux system membrane fusion protein